MANILIVDDECELLELLCILIEGEGGHQVLKADNTKSAIEMIAQNQVIDLVLCDWNMSGGGGESITKYLRENRPLPFVLMSGNMADEFNKVELSQGLPFFDILEKPFEMDSLLKLIKTALAGRQPIPMSSTDYCRVSLSSLSQEQSIAYALFLKLSDKKFVKVSLQNEKTLREIIDHYRQKDVDAFYMTRPDFDSWVNSLFDVKKEQLESELKYSNKQGLSALGQVCRKYHSRLHLELSAFGVNQEHVEMVGLVVDEIVRELNERPDLSELVELILLSENFLSDHTFFIIFLASYLAKDLGLSSAATTKKIVYAAFFHDLAIKEPELVRRENHLEKITDHKTHQQLSEHPQAIVEMLGPFAELKGDVANIILEHHELPDGSGYPHGINAGAIHPLSCLFILCHKASELFLLDGLSPAQVAAQLRGDIGEFYNAGNFKRALQVLRAHFSV